MPVRIYADFNSTDEAGRVWALSFDADEPPFHLEPGQEVILYMEEIEVDGTIIYDNGSWLAVPNRSTYRMIPNWENLPSKSRKPLNWQP